jgi:hypothetical protein
MLHEVAKLARKCLQLSFIQGFANFYILFSKIISTYTYLWYQYFDENISIFSFHSLICILSFNDADPKGASDVFMQTTSKSTYKWIRSCLLLFTGYNSINILDAFSSRKIEFNISALFLFYFRAISLFMSLSSMVLSLCSIISLILECLFSIIDAI